MEAKKRKTLIIIGSLLALGGAGFLIWKFGFKKDSSDVEIDTETDYTPDGSTSSGGTSGTSKSTETIPEEKEATPEEVLATSFKEAKKAMGMRRKDYPDYSTVVVDAKNYGLPSDGTKFYLVVNKDGIWRLWYIPAGQPESAKTMIMKGRYYQGGKQLNVGYAVGKWASNKSRKVTGTNLGTNLKKLVLT